MTTPSGPRKSLARDQSGQLLVMWMIFMLPMVVLCFGVYNVGVMVSEKMKVQNAADNAAYSAATWNARYMNQMAYLNRAMVANYDTIATFTGIWSFIDATDGFISLIRTILRIFFNIGEAITPAAKALHKANDIMSQVLGGGKKNPRVGRALEEYNRALSFAQQGLYIANQAGRGRVAQTIAWGVDPRIQYWFPSEIWGVQEIANRRDWRESDEQKGLRLTVERSLNALANGGSFRDASNFPVLGTVVNLINKIPCFFLTIGPEGFNGPGFNHVTGGGITPGQSLPPKTFISTGNRMQIVQPDKIYQLDHNGLRVGFDCIVSFTLISFGHFSDDDANLPNAIGLDFPHAVDEEGDHGGDTFDGGFGKNFIGRNVECESIGGSVPNLDALGGQDFQNLSELNQNLCGESAGSCTVVDVDGDNPPDLPPGPICPGPLGIEAEKEARRIAANAARAQQNPPQPAIPKSVIADDRSCQSIQQELDNKQKQLTKDLAKGQKASSNPCATVYEFQTPLAEMKVTHYIEKNDVPDGKRVEGPSVFVYVRKRAEQLPLFRGLGLLNDKNIEAYAFGRAYYTQRPNGGTSEKETAFNPFWAGRLEKAPFLFH